MATKERNKQKLINYHSSTKDETRKDFDVRNLDYGEIAVRHHVEQPELYIRTGEDTYAIFCDVEATNALIMAQTSQINQDLGRLSGNVISFSGNVVNNYATKAEVVSGDNRIYASATSYTNEVSGNIQSYILETYWTSAETQEKINSINSAASNTNQIIGELSGQLISFSGIVLDDYATKAEAVSGDNRVYASATSYTNEVSGNIQSYILKTYWTSAETQSKLNTINSAVTNLTQDVGRLSGSVIAFSGAAIDYIDDKLSNVYIYKGSVDYVENLSAHTPANVGDVYNVVNANGTEGEPGYTPEGTNYAWNGSEWDALGGTIDLSNYVTVDQLAASNSALTDLTQSVGNLSGSVISFSGEVISEYATKAEVVSGDNRIYASATSYTKEVSGNIQSYILKTYWTSAETQSKLNTINSAVTNLTQDVGRLSGSVISFSGNVVNNYVTKTEAASGDNRIYASATSYTNEVSGNIQSYILETYWTSAETQTELNTINSGITNLTQELGQLSGRVYTHVEPLAETALHSFALSGAGSTSTGRTSEQSGAVAKYTVGSGATLDLSALVIDCGEF